MFTRTGSIGSNNTNQICLVYLFSSAASTPPFRVKRTSSFLADMFLKNAITRSVAQKRHADVRNLFLKFPSTWQGIHSHARNSTELPVNLKALSMRINAI